MDIREELLRGETGDKTLDNIIKECYNEDMELS